MQNKKNEFSDDIGVVPTYVNSKKNMNQKLN